MPIYGFYDLSLRSLRALSPPLGLWNSSKLGRGVRGRIVSARTFDDWGRTYRVRERPLVWFHAPSVGEGLQARAVMLELMRVAPEVQLAYTFFSPSAEGMLQRMPVHVAGYLPWDTRPDMERALDALRPDLVVFTKTEVWPVLATVARERNVAAALAAATLPPGAGRLRWPARRFLRRAFASLRAVLAISEEDRARFQELGVAPEASEVTGDPAIDSASGRVGAVDAEASHLRPFHRYRRPTLVAGSTWPPDERALLPALKEARERVEGLRVILAPHEPAEPHLAALARTLRSSGWTVARLDEVEARGHAQGVDVVLVERVGVLAELYTVGDVAYVGGGFHRHGLHSVLEPAAAGLPVLFGPRHGNAQAAADLVVEGGAKEVSGSATLAGALAGWFDDRAARERAGAAAARYVEGHRGAAIRTAQKLAEFLPAMEARAG